LAISIKWFIPIAQKKLSLGAKASIAMDFYLVDFWTALILFFFRKYHSYLLQNITYPDL
jgi:hypothetical protein